MSIKAIEFEELAKICKHRNEQHKPDMPECEEEDNITGECNHHECAIWSDLKTEEPEE